MRGGGRGDLLIRLWIAASARFEIRNDIRDSPSLRRHLEDNLHLIYGDAVEEALVQMNRQAADLPAECPWTVDQLMDGDIGSLLQ